MYCPSKLKQCSWLPKSGPVLLLLCSWVQLMSTHSTMTKSTLLLRRGACRFLPLAAVDKGKGYLFSSNAPEVSFSALQVTRSEGWAIFLSSPPPNGLTALEYGCSPALTFTGLALLHPSKHGHSIII